MPSISLFKKLGLRLNTVFKAVIAEIKTLNDEQIQKQLDQGYFEVLGNRIELDEVRVTFCLDGNDRNISSKYEAHSDNDVLVLMDLTPTDDLMEEGIAREIITRIQKLKKKAQLVPTDSVIVLYEVNSANNIITKVANSHNDFIQSTIKSPFIPYKKEDVQKIVISESFDLKDVKLKIIICLPKTDEILPATKWANFVRGAAKGTVLLHDFDSKFLTLDELRNEIDILFRLHGRKVYLLDDGKMVTSVESLHEKTIVVADKENEKCSELFDSSPFVKFVNTEYKGKPVTVILENPKGKTLGEGDTYLKKVLKF